jgi:hypothetical protein
MWKAILFVTALFFTSISSQPFDRVLLTNSLADGASCLDGSAPAYYFKAGNGTGVNKWYLYHEGGGWCTNLTDCLERSKTNLGSSKAYPPTIGYAGGYFSRDPAVNPLMYNWNVAFFRYCDGGSFSGLNDTVTEVQGTKLYFRGLRNLQAYLFDLNTRNMKSGTDFVIGGCSAGGLATYLHVDWWRQNVPATARVRGMPDSGFFLDYDSQFAPKYATDMAWVFKQNNASSGVNQDCIAAHLATGDTYKCFFAEHTVPFLKTPIFPLQSEFDSWQIGNILGSKNIDDVNEYGKLLTQRFSVVTAKAMDGCWLDSCYHHCYDWDSIRIDGQLSGPAFSDWYNGASKGQFIQGKPYPCDACCKPN